ncbi:MAG: PAS-domain containing protein [Pseudomonadota bacterium]
MSVVIGSLTTLIGGGLAGLLALGAILWLAPRPRRHPHRAESFSDPRHLVFRQGYLIEQSDNVGFLLPDPVNRLSAWDDLVDTLSDLTDHTVAAFQDLRDTGRPLRLDGTFGRDRITVLGSRDGEDIRITVAATDTDQSSIRMDLACLTALESELEMLARAHATNSTLSWVSDAEGRIVWANAAYADLLALCHGPDAARGWPLIALFPDGDAPAGTSRRKTTDRTGAVHWFEVTTLPADQNGQRFAHAVSLAAAIRAEDGRRAFIQTLTKSFAFLPTGLAIFDKDGQLAQFNPALMDMTGLDPQWLSRRPRLSDFFDALRERQRLPEPRNYKDWRDTIAKLGQAETASAYHETWTLPSGPTYRMTARPQSDGAVTLLFEDVSADVSATRAAREDRSMLAAIIETMDEAILAFDADGTLRVDNAAARDLWLGAGDDGCLPQTLDGCISFWQDACDPSPAWGDLRSFARNASDRAEWTERLSRDDSVPLDMRVTPLPENRISVAFLPRPDALSVPASAAHANLPAE